MIPKIIHHTAPADRNLWHPLWFECLDSWNKQFPHNEYTHLMWTDEDIDNLVKTHYSAYYDLYQSFPFHIIRVDFARMCMLHNYGGIYTDMDIFCYKNFYEDIKTADIALVQAHASDEVVQNSLMASSKGNTFWEIAMEEILRSNYNHVEGLCKSHYVKDIAGPYFLSRQALKSSEHIWVLEKELYNPSYTIYNKDIITKHMLTSVWVAEEGQSFTSHYKQNRGVELDKFNFYTNYT